MLPMMDIGCSSGKVLVGKMKKIDIIKKWFGKVYDWLAWLSAAALCLIAVRLLFQVFVFASFSVPTDSMRPTIVPGDYLLVNKLLKGARLFNLNDAFDHKPLKITRLKGLEDFRRNEVLVFNFPYPERWDSIGFNVMRYYVKRCIALPGDTLEIRNAHYHVKGYDGELGNVGEQNMLAFYLESERNRKEMIKSGCFYTYPRDSVLGWTVEEFGPFYLPARGSRITMDERHYILYRNLIEWEQRKKLTFRDGRFYLGGEEIRQYVFTHGYYFMGGDNCHNSQDSRYWGPLPDEYIVGKAVRIWKSKNKMTDKIRWSRVFKKIE